MWCWRCPILWLNQKINFPLKNVSIWWFISAYYLFQYGKPNVSDIRIYCFRNIYNPLKNNSINELPNLKKVWNYINNIISFVVHGIVEHWSKMKNLIFPNAFTSSDMSLIMMLCKYRWSINIQTAFELINKFFRFCNFYQISFKDPLFCILDTVHQSPAIFQ